MRRLRLKIPVLVAMAALWLVGIAIFTGLLRPYEITRMDLMARLAPTGTPGHILGTDGLRRDVLSRLLQTILMPLMIAFGVTILSAISGTTLRFPATQFRGWVEHLV